MRYAQPERGFRAPDLDLGLFGSGRLNQADGVAQMIKHHDMLSRIASRYSLSDVGTAYIRLMPTDLPSRPPALLALLLMLVRLKLSRWRRRLTKMFERGDRRLPPPHD